MKHIVVDLEMNKIGKRFPERAIWNSETIEIGAVMLDESFREISSFRTYVHPQFCDGIARKISKLTGITDECVAQAPDFNVAFRMFTNWCLGTGDEITVYAWSDSDYNQIVHEMIMKGYVPSEEERTIIDSEWEDFQKRFDERLGFERQVSLANALNMAGIDFVGREHTALDDARNTAELFTVFQDEVLFEKTLAKIKEAMTVEPLTETLGSLFDFSSLQLA